LWEHPPKKIPVSQIDPPFHMGACKRPGAVSISCLPQGTHRDNHGFPPKGPFLKGVNPGAHVSYTPG